MDADDEGKETAVDATEVTEYGVSNPSWTDVPADEPL